MEGKVALITGGAQGIGKAYSRELLKNGVKVIIADISESIGNETVQEFKKIFGPDKVKFYYCDVTDPQQFEGCFVKAGKDFGGVDILINNAGVCNETDSGWRKMLDINVFGLVTGTKLGFKYMSRSNGGKGGLIINIASITSLEPWEIVPVYSASKAYVNQLSRSYGTELHYRSSGVKVIAINPGLTDTKILDDVRNECISDQVKQACPKFLEPYPIQAPDNMGKGLIYVINTATNGSLWTIENDKAPKLAAFK